MTLEAPTTLTLQDIHMRDPFLLVLPDGTYRLYGTTDDQPWSGPGHGFDMYASTDLLSWTGPVTVFQPEPDFRGVSQFWAPEVHPWNGNWYMLATFADARGGRGTYVLNAVTPDGPFVPLTGAPITPDTWMCLDGTLHRAANGTPWLVFCREWLEVRVGEIWAMPLQTDLTAAAAPPALLFRADEAPWTVPLPASETDMEGAYVTDGPFISREDDNSLTMIWSSRTPQGYAVGVARARNGDILGPWEHAPAPLWDQDGGHAMIARLADGSRRLVLHAPNTTPDERPTLLPLTMSLE